MALLPIIYLSILITSILIISVVLVSYIASKIRNRRNGDRILAIAYNGTSAPLINKRETKIVIQKRKHTGMAQKNNDRELYARDKRQQTNFERTTSTTREQFETKRDTEIRNRNFSPETKSYSPDRRSSTEGFQQRVEILNQTKSDSLNISGGDVKIRTSNPLYFYSAQNDQHFYSIKAS